MTLVSINGRSFVAEMFWQTAENTDARALEVARQTVETQVKSAKEAGEIWDAVCIRGTSPRQFGLVALGRPGNRRFIAESKTTPSLAAALALTKASEAWGGIFALKEGFYYLEVRKGYIQVESDKLIGYDTPGAEELAKGLIARMQNTSLLDEVFAPASLHLSGTREVSVEALLKSYRGRFPACRPVHSRLPHGIFGQRWFKWGFVAAGLMAGLYIANEFFSPAELPTEPQAAQPPWEADALPTAISMLETCTRDILAYPSLPGWHFTGAECTASDVRSSYDISSRLGMAWMPKSVPPNCSLSVKSQSQVDLTCRRNEIERLRSPLELRPVQEAKLAVFIGIAGFGKATLEAETAPPANQPSPGDNNAQRQPAPPSWKTLSFKWEGGFPAADLEAGISTVKAFTVSKVGFKSPRTWNVEGKIYGR